MFLIVLTAVSAGAAAYLGAYLKQKGKNLATSEDIDKLVEQVSAVTEATKKIEADISTEVWNRQRQWELKKETLLNAMTCMMAVRDKLVGLYAIHQVDRKLEATASPRLIEKMTEAARELNKALNRFDEAFFAASLVCAKDVQEELHAADLFFRKLAEKLMGDEPEVWDTKAAELGQRITNASKLMRRELGLPPE